MDVKQLEYFRAIVDAGTISGAARVLHMTQPPQSYQVKMLEEELQVQLFLRGTKKITLTEAGKTLYDRAGSLLTMADITKREVIKASQAATIHIGFTPSTVSMMSDYLIRFSTSHPDIRFDIHEGSTFTLREQLENGVVDITTLRTPIVLKGCESRTLMQEKLLAGLSELGYLDRKSGKGTFVAEKRIQRNISKGVTGFSEMCRTMGAVPGAKTIKIAIEDPTEKDMELMHITPDKKILVLERIRYADEKPVLLEINRFPESFSFLFGENLNDTSLYDVVKQA